MTKIFNFSPIEEEKISYRSLSHKKINKRQYDRNARYTRSLAHFEKGSKKVTGPKLLSLFHFFQKSAKYIDHSGNFVFFMKFCVA